MGLLCLVSKDQESLCGCCLREILLAMNVGDIAIKIDNLSKCHQIYDRPEDRLKQLLVPRIQRSLGAKESRYYKEFWALQDVSLEVRKGETLGIIGRNGAGKSTLLQLLCGTLSPTTGSILTNGRIAALLELGSGFNSEFTGRENVYLNATVLGLSREEIDRRFDAIAAFADIGDFIDQPVKTYSSGMYVRLAFAVMAHVSADILVIDEALAVGDVIFTQKCMRFLRNFKENGTLIFVSHDTHSVASLCQKALWLDRGRPMMYGEAKEVSEAYMQFSLQEMYGETVKLESVKGSSHVDSDLDKATKASDDSSSTNFDDSTKVTIFDNLDESSGWKTDGARICSVSLSRKGEKDVKVLRGGDVLLLEIFAELAKDMDNPIIGFLVKDRLGQTLFAENTFEHSSALRNAASGDTICGRFEFQLPMLPSGHYSMTVAVAEGTPSQNIQHHWLHDALIFSVVSTKPWLGLMGIPFRQVALEKVSSPERRVNA